MTEIKKNAADYLQDAADTYRERHKVYGNNYLMVGRVMAAFFPEGIKLRSEEDHNRFHIFMLKVVKLTRYVENWKKGGHADSTLDDVVYGAMLLEIDQDINKASADLEREMQDLFKVDEQSHPASPPIGWPPATPPVPPAAHFINDGSEKPFFATAMEEKGGTIDEAFAKFLDPEEEGE